MVSEEQICFVCHLRITKGSSSRIFRRGEHEVAIHQECLQLFRDLVQEAVGLNQIREISEVSSVCDRIQELVQRDSDGLFTIASERIYYLAAREAVATVLYVESRPLSVSELAKYLRRFYKEVPSSSISIYLTARDPSTSIRIYVRRIERGYELNEAGIRWFEQNVALKILGEKNTNLNK